MVCGILRKGYLRDYLLFGTFFCTFSLSDRVDLSYLDIGFSFTDPLKCGMVRERVLIQIEPINDRLSANENRSQSVDRWGKLKQFINFSL